MLNPTMNTNVENKWDSSSWGRKLIVQKRRASLTDFDRFKVMLASIKGTDDRVVPPLMIYFVRQIVPGVTVHKLPREGHFSYFCFCDQCHKDILQPFW